MHRENWFEVVLVILVIFFFGLIAIRGMKDANEKQHQRELEAMKVVQFDMPNVLYTIRLKGDIDPEGLRALKALAEQNAYALSSILDSYSRDLEVIRFQIMAERIIGNFNEAIRLAEKLKNH